MPRPREIDRMAAAEGLTIAEFFAKYRKEGEAIEDTAARIGVSWRTVRRTLDREGIPRARRPATRHYEVDGITASLWAHCKRLRVVGYGCAYQRVVGLGWSPDAAVKTPHKIVPLDE